MNFLETIQRREAIDEDKKLSKRIINSNFAFIQNLGEERLPPSVDDRRVVFAISRYIQQISQNLEGCYNSALEDQQKGEKYIVMDIGPACNIWNELVIYMKSYKPAEKFSTSDREEFFNELNEQVVPLGYQILKLYDDLKANIGIPMKGRPKNEGVVFVDKKSLETLIQRIEDKNLTIIALKFSLDKEQLKLMPAGTSSDDAQEIIRKAKNEIKLKLGDDTEYFLQNMDEMDEDEKRQYYAKIKPIFVKYKLPTRKDYITGILNEISSDLELALGDEEDEEEDEEGEGEEEGEEEGEGEGEGFGKPKRMNKKKMDDDILQIQMETKQKKDLNHNHKVMDKKVNKAKNFLYNDSNDSGYLK